MGIGVQWPVEGSVGTEFASW